MDGSPQVVRFDATTLWHFDAAEWAPSTASIAPQATGQGRGACPLLLQFLTSRSAAAERRDVPTGDIGESYSITSSARASSVGGTSRPSALAVLRLMTSSNFVGCSTGRSP